MSEEETLGKVAYEAYHNAWKANGLHIVQIGWDKLREDEKKPWIGVAKAVADRVLEEIVANQASGA